MGRANFEDRHEETDGDEAQGEKKFQVQCVAPLIDTVNYHD